MSKLSPSQRKQIISDYKNGISNEDYRVIDQGNGKYQVRKRESGFKCPPKPKKPHVKIQEEQEEEEEVKEPKKDNNRMSNEELFRKLSTLLQVPEPEVEQTPQEYEQEEEAYDQTQQYLNSYAQQGYSPYRRQPLRLY